MKEQEYHDNLKQIFEAAALILTLPLAEMADLMEHADSVGPILHPSEWIQAKDNLDQHKTIVHALWSAQRQIEPARNHLLAAYMKHLQKVAEAAERDPGV